MAHPRAAALVAALVLAAASAPAGAQQVVLSGRGDPEVDRRIDAVLAGGRYTLLARDTTIGRRDTLRGPVLAAGIRLRLDGTIVGDLVGVGSDLFLHPSAVVTGDVVNAGGGLYPSTLAHLGGVLDRPLASYTVTRNATLIRIDARRNAGSALAFDALHGLEIPQYDRVDGLWLQAGGRLRLPSAAGLDSAALHLVGGWRTGGPGGTFTADLQARRGRLTAIFGGQRLTTTSDRWIRGDLANSLAFLVGGLDYRDYYDSRRLFAGLARDFDRGRWAGHVALLAGRERDASLRTRDTWVLFKPDSLRPNPAVDEGVLSSGGAQAAIGWTGASSSFAVGGRLEAAGKVASGDVAFRRYETWGHANIRALWTHTLEVEWHVQGPLPGTDRLPRQRWSHVGGGATLPTYPIGAFPGDRVAFVSSEYVAPLPHAVRFPVIGVPSLAVLHAAGMGWTAGQSRRLEQNLGLELRALGLALRATTNPAHARHDLQFQAGLAFSTGRSAPARPYFDTASLER